MSTQIPEVIMNQKNPNQIRRSAKEIEKSSNVFFNWFDKVVEPYNESLPLGSSIKEYRENLIGRSPLYDIWDGLRLKEPFNDFSAINKAFEKLKAQTPIIKNNKSNTPGL